MVLPHNSTIFLCLALFQEWRRNYRHQGGFSALFRCLRGMRRLRHLDSGGTSSQEACSLEALTFSVVPKMTFLWSRLMQAIMPESGRVIIGDCSGGFPAESSHNHLVVHPLLNLPHGVKLDLFIRSICSAPYVVVSDDDVFWLSEQPIRWALAQFEASEHVAVVSLMPRERLSSVLKAKLTEGMGSYCLVIKRDVWLREALSFQIVYPAKEKGFDWFYDTADFANVELINRGYKVVVAPPEVRKDLCCLEGISTWTLKIQQRAGRLHSSIQGVAIRRAKGLRATLILRKLGQLVAMYCPSVRNSEIVAPSWLNRAEACCRAGLSAKDCMTIEAQVNSVIACLRTRLEALQVTHQPRANIPKLVNSIC